MVMTWFAGFLLLGDTGYEPRHRSKRQASPAIGWLGQRRREEYTASAAISPWSGFRSTAGASWMPSPPAESEPDDRPASTQLHRMLESCALDDLARIIPEIVQVMVRSSADTMTSAWTDFREATWNAKALRLGPGLWMEPIDPGPEEPDPYPGEDAVVIKVGQAPDALWLITNAPNKLAVRSP
jgi:hypothetical protein